MNLLIILNRVAALQQPCQRYIPLDALVCQLCAAPECRYQGSAARTRPHRDAAGLGFLRAEFRLHLSTFLMASTIALNSPGNAAHRSRPSSILKCCSTMTAPRLTASTHCMGSPWLEKPMGNFRPCAT